MRALLCFLIVLSAWPAQLRVEMRDFEVWLIRDGHEVQLTHDGKSKSQAELSVAQDRIAYYEECNQAAPCTPAVVILDLEGHRVTSFQPKHQAVPPLEPCASILSIAWVADNAIAAVCHINPSLSEYLETDLSTGQTTRDLLGFDFTIAPDRKGVAHVGRIVHFAPPYAQSNYLQLDHLTIYPLPKGAAPVEQKGLDEPPAVVIVRNLTYSGIHEFMPGIAWSPDSQRIALVDCTYDWTANHAGALSAADGKESNRRCSLAVVTTKGAVNLFSLTDVPNQEMAAGSVTWLSPRKVSFTAEKMNKTFTLP